MKFTASVAALIFLCLSTAQGQRPGDFRVIGPGGGGAMFNPTISPHDFNTVLIACDMTGSYITHDGGRTWRMFNLRGVVNFFAFDPHDPKIMYAHATGLWRSADGGESWKLVYPSPVAVQGVQMNSDHADETILAQADPLGVILAMAIDPADSHVLYVTAGPAPPRRAAGLALRPQEKLGLFVSRDSGQSWQRQADLSGEVRRLWVDPHSPAEARVLYAGGRKSVAVVNGAKVRDLPLPAPATDISMGFGDGARPVIYIASEKGVFVSHDGGAGWNRSLLPGNGAQVRAIAASLHHPETAYASYSRLTLDGKTWLGVAKTTNSGADWQLVWKESAGAAANVHDNWITERFGIGWGENPLNLTVADQNPNLSIGTDLGRTMRTTDGGANWAGLYSRRVDSAGWTTVGLDVTTTYGVHFDPFDSKRMFITYTDIGLFRSEDGGASWTSSTSGVPREWMNTTYWLVFDPKVKGRVWSVNSYTHDLPRPKMWRHAAVSTYKGGVCRSEDGGKSWAKSNAGMEPTAATHILLDPSSPVDTRVLYVSGFGRGVYKSIDSGRTWTLKNEGITQKEPFAWRLARSSKGTLYVVIARRSEDGSIGNDGDGALYRSTDGAEHWQRVTLPDGVNGPNGLAIDPDSPDRLYLASWAKATGQHGDGGGIYISEDGGKSWHLSFDKDRHVYDVTIDPVDANVLYATGFESSAWRSADRGWHWARIPGFNFKMAHRVIPDPQDHNQIYITTFGGSVWHGFINGKEQPVDIVTPALEQGQ
jgi:photosystem II stability/assembly factor-like uncharacterized protein